MQGAHDQDFYVTKYKVAIAHDDSFAEWSDYTDIDGNVVITDVTVGQEMITHLSRECFFNFLLN